MNPGDPKKVIRPDENSDGAAIREGKDPRGRRRERGLDVAENETREAVTDAYENAARRSEDPQENLDDIDYEEEQAPRSGPDKEPGSI